MFEVAVLVVCACMLLIWLLRWLVPRVRRVSEAFHHAPSGPRGVYYVEDPVPLRARGVACTELGRGLYVVEFPVSGRMIFSTPERREYLTAIDGATFVATPRSDGPDKPWRLVGPVPVQRRVMNGGGSWSW
ncbi:hypothetical protein [Sorangium sp. So ce1151]|uniref:hypothetical protein n=1 Tax=Sorangium sp. So ce1151 TaxID=3133332 RepID=UPI003F618F3E